MEFTIVDGRTFVTGHPHALIRSVKGGREGERQGGTPAPARAPVHASTRSKIGRHSTRHAVKLP